MARGSEVLALLNQLGAEFSQLGHRLRETSGLGNNDLAALRHIVGAPPEQPIGVGDIAERLHLTSGAATGVVDRLERAGHVIRVRDATDRRRVYLTATAKAHEMASTVFGGLAKQLHQIVDELDDDELATIERFLQQATGVITAQRDSSREGAAPR